MSGVSTGAALLGAGALTAGTSVAGGMMGSGAQTSAADSASATQMAMFNKTQQNLQPYMDVGTTATNKLMGQLDTLTAPVTMDQATLAKTPGYQFALNQGLQSTQNSAAARGLGSSGAALKGAANFATGLADNTYQQQFSNAVTNQTNTFNRLMGLTELGQSSAAGVSNAGIQTGNSIASNTIGAGNAQAAGWNSGASSGGSSLGQALIGYSMYNGSNNRINPVSGGVA